jgi:hypothetical protein
LKIDASNVWNKIQSLKGLKRNNQINIIINKTIIPQQETAKQLGGYFQKNSSILNITTEFRNIKFKAEKTPIQFKINQNNPLQIQLNEDISINEILYALSKCKASVQMTYRSLFSTNHCT